MSDEEIKDLNKFDFAIYVEYCWIKFNILRPNFGTKSDNGIVKVESDRVQELQEYEKNFVSKVKRK